MKPQSMRVAFLVLFGILTAIFVAITWPFAKAAFLAFTLAVIFFPLYRFVLKKLRLPRYVAATITTLAVGACVILPFGVIIAIVVTKIGHFLQSITIQVDAGSFSGTIQPLLASIQSWIEKLTGSAPSMAEMQTALQDTLKEAGRKFYEFSPRVLSTTISIVINFILMLVFLVVFFAEGSPLFDWIMETSPISPEHRKELARDVRVTISSSIAAALITALIQGTLLGLGFWLAGFDQPYSWGLVAILLSIIPVVGASSCYITASAMLFSMGKMHAAILFLIFGFGIISTIDNFIRPLVMRSAISVHPLLLFVVLIGAMNLIGPIGLLVGPVLLSIFLAALRIYRREFAEIG